MVVEALLILYSVQIASDLSTLPSEQYWAPQAVPSLLRQYQAPPSNTLKFYERTNYHQSRPIRNHPYSC
jgi:hypothetical protein